ncbi:acyl-CoA dehydrogenase [Alcaligenaceae bacterium]|nr:acyl-CoA dehydrogenase [Alcaligenaceae bacterium]
MIDQRFLDWPFFETAHRELHACLEAFVANDLGFFPDTLSETPDEVEKLVRRTVAELGRRGLLIHALAWETGTAPDVRSVCITREVLARFHGLADFAYAMQGLGSGPISLFGNPEQRRRYLNGVAAGELIAAFALSEAEAGSDVAAIQTRAVLKGGEWHLSGEKAWISNAGIADFYIIFARSDDNVGSKGISAFIVDAQTPGLTVTERPQIVAPHPIGTIRLNDCRVPQDCLIGDRGKGFAIAMATLDVFRTSVGAAALGFARCALNAAAMHARQRSMFGGQLADLQIVRGKLADMELDVEAAALLTYRSAWVKDKLGGRVSREASMAKLFSTEAAQRVVDECVQLHGGRGVVKGSTPERLYRDVRALRIYEGANEIHKMIIANQLLQIRA